ncbi:hypothetical protein PAPYR_10152 [Paratrimastix pyriformis]|uniref:Uncharacterized protein n=1 Tax=Paratrimastix pyriformis TaxID=342808 RepID=A0ABQ8U6J5_9EUKA|nr:hypothetical protein PAPYR_10152 [Paratrimastix pyriformis]
MVSTTKNSDSLKKVEEGMEKLREQFARCERFLFDNDPSFLKTEIDRLQADLHRRDHILEKLADLPIWADLPPTSLPPEPTPVELPGAGTSDLALPPRPAPFVPPAHLLETAALYQQQRAVRRRQQPAEQADGAAAMTPGGGDGSSVGGAAEGLEGVLPEYDMGALLGDIPAGTAPSMAMAGALPVPGGLQPGGGAMELGTPPSGGPQDGAFLGEAPPGGGVSGGAQPGAGDAQPRAPGGEGGDLGGDGGSAGEFWAIDAGWV